MKKYAFPLIMLAVFEAVAVTLWLAKDNIFYLFNFSYIGVSIALGVFLFIRKYKYARRVVQLLVGTYMLVYLGLICGENMQIEGFWYYLFTGVFEAATIHYAAAKIGYLSQPIFLRGERGVLKGRKSSTAAVQQAYPHQPRPKMSGPKIFATA